MMSDFAMNIRVGLVAFFVLLIVAPILLVMHQTRKAEKVERRQQYFDVSDRAISAASSKSIRKVKENIDKLDTAYFKVKDVMNSDGDYLYAKDRQMLTEQLHDLEQDKWQRKADRYLQEFADCYELIVNGDLENFKDVDLLFKMKKRCINRWQSYFAIDLTEYETTIYPKRYLREYMGDDYDPCMESHDALEKKLSTIVDSMRPEYKRKTALYGLIVSYVAAQGSIARSDLMKVRFPGYIDGEVKCCYRALVKGNRLVEVKLGGRYFVSLSDKETAKKPAQSEKEKQEMIARSDKLVHDAVVKHLMDEGIEYIDMTHKGGGLYFFSERIAEELKEKGYNIGYAENGSRSTSGRSAWYLKQ